MKSVFVIGSLNDKLTSVLDRCVEEKLIYHYVNYEIHNNIQKRISEETRIAPTLLSNKEFCEKFISTTKDFENWIILKGDIHTDDFLRILINMEKSFIPQDLFLSHILQLTSPDGKLSFYLSDGAVNTKQFEHWSILGKVINNAQNYILSKRCNIGKIDPVINTAIILAANNSNVPGYETVNSAVWIVPDPQHIEIKQLDECFDMNAWLIKHKDADAMMFTYPDVIITPDITVGNVIWKSLTILNGWTAKGYVIGGNLETVLLSRSDSEENYYESIKGLIQK